ncbi:MAG: response regulator transcription factor [Halieaceae bacterium]|nr:response regulator transcription factor [Halieaceae bacterium]MBT5209451.1 response regulator transcription factor [Halieaceae bacterium]MBT6264609.1 response regulator transcription factor [Halieaceae bacterium]
MYKRGVNVKVAVVDDEPLAREFLTQILNGSSDIEVTASYKNGREAITGLRLDPVDVVFLDIQMPGLGGFEVVQALQSDTMPLVVFATAHSEFAVEAFDLHAVDYILKPFSAERVYETLSRCATRLMALSVDSAEDGPDVTDRAARQKGAVISAMGGQSGRVLDAANTITSMDVGKLAIKDGQQTTLLQMDEIEWIDAAGDYMCVHASGQTHILRSTMKELVARLPDNFVRIHRSTIVNLSKVEVVEGLPKGEAQLLIVGGGVLKVSRNFRKEIQNLLI